MAVLEALSKFNKDNNIDNEINEIPVEDGSPEVYIRQNKEKELDLLWKDFKMPRGEHSPIVFLGIGFAAGVIATIAISTLIGLNAGEIQANVKHKQETAAISATVNNQEEADVNESAEAVAEETVAESNETTSKKFGFLPISNNNKNVSEATDNTAQQQQYEVVSGDTMESIAKKFYGSYSPEKIEAIMKANNMTNPNKLGIGQKLSIPPVKDNSNVVE